MFVVITMLGGVIGKLYNQTFRKSENMKLAKVEGLYHPNLLINGDFQVNQRGNTRYEIGDLTYTFDRWCGSGWMSIEKTSNGVKVQNNADINSNQWFMQKLETHLSGTFTLSVKVISKNGKAVAKIESTDSLIDQVDLSVGDNVLTVNTEDLAIITIEIGGSTTYADYVEIAYIKLEQGSIATPFIPRLYAEELALCERYTLKIPNSYNAYTGSGGKIYIVYQKLMNMRTNPNVIALPSRTNIVINNGTVNFDIESILCNKETGEITVNVNNPTSTLFSKTIGGWFSNSVILDAEIK